MITAYPSRLESRPVAFLLICSLLPVAGCRLSNPPHPEPPTQTDRLMQAYPELRDGRSVVVIADFENPAHMELVELIGVSDKARCVLDGKHGRPETGKTCLDFTAGSSEDTVVISNNHAEQWYLKRDWRDFDLLLMSVKSPRRDLSIDVEIAGGAPKQRQAVHSTVALEQGWNLLRLDLAEVGERIPLDDVREIRLSVSGLDKPANLHIDDLILTGNRADLFGDSRNTAGELYVQRAGRRWNIGAGGRFELTFANGQIVRWHNLAQDPYRLRNLVEGTTLGPSPMPVDASGSGEGGFEALGKVVRTRARITEMNVVRAVITCEWRFVDDPNARVDDRPFQRWVYTVYPTGQVYVAVESTAKAESQPATQLGLAATMSTKVDDGMQIHVSSESGQPPTYGTARSESADALLLYVLGEPHELKTIREQRDGDRGRVSLLAIRPPTDAGVEKWVCLLTLGRASEISDAEAAARAADYAKPGGFHLKFGSFAVASRPGVGESGFDRASGCYVISPDRGRVLLTVDGRTQPRFSPAFKIINTEGREAWVYVNHLSFDKVARDTEGNLLFQLPDIIRNQTIVEVLFRQPQRSGSS